MRQRGIPNAVGENSELGGALFQLSEPFHGTASVTLSVWMDVRHATLQEKVGVGLPLPSPATAEVLLSAGTPLFRETAAK